MYSTDRRGFFGVSAAAGTAAFAAGFLRAEDARPLRLGVIGVGGYGMADARAALKAGGAEIVAVCDVDSQHLENAAGELAKQQGQRPQTFKRYEELLDLQGLDAVIIATPPHWHALQLIAAVERGINVYCEKPVSYDLREGQAMVAAVQKSGRVVQIGFQRRQSAAMREATEFIKSGGIGKLIQVDAQIHYQAGLGDPTPQDPPASLDWDLWCGPGPKIPYSPQVGHRSWRLEKTSGHGHLVDWGIHHVDAIRTFLGLSMPKQITASGGLYRHAGRITTPDTLSVHFEFEVPVHWRHRLWGATEWDSETNNGIFFFGERGTIFAADDRWIVIPPGKDAKREVHRSPADLGTLHMANFLDAVRKGEPPQCTIEDAFRSTATVQLAMIAYETNSVVRWEETKLEIVDNPAASQLLKRDYRQPWKHPYQG